MKLKDIVPDNKVKKKQSFAYLRKLKKSKKFKNKFEDKRTRLALGSEHKVIITNRSGFKVRVSLLKAFVVGTTLTLPLKIGGKRKEYNASYFSFSAIRLWRKMQKDDAFFDEVYRLYYVLSEGCKSHLEDSRLMKFLTKLERAIQRHRYKENENEVQ